MANSTLFMGLVLGGGVVALALAQWMTIYMAVATVAYLLMVSGLIWRQRRGLHVALMSMAMFTDLSLVLLLEWQRSAIDQALSFAMSPLQQAHIGFSTLALLGYFPTLILGVLLYRNPGRRPHLRPWHLRLGVASFAFRSLGFLFMFSLL